LEDPIQGRPSKLAILVRTLESKLSRGASWTTIHGKLTYNPRERAILITDRAEMTEEAAKAHSRS